MRSQLITLLALAVIATGCGSKDNYAGRADSNDLRFTTVTESATFALKGSAGTFLTPGDALFSDSVSLVMPVVLNGSDVAPLRDSILKMAVDSVGADVHAVIAGTLGRDAASCGFPAEKLDAAASAATSDSVMTGFNIVTGRVVYLTPGLLVYRVGTDNYMPGAAHGMHTNYYINYDIAGGRIIPLQSIFTADGIKALPSRIAARATDLAPILGPTDIISLPSSDNYMISSGGEIVFVYQPYEVASYAQGSVRVPFYPYELVDIMTPFGIQLFNLQDLND